MSSISDWMWTHTQTVTTNKVPGQIYGRLTNEIFEVHKNRIIAFKPPIKGELFVDCTGVKAIAAGVHGQGEPRFILRPLRKKYVFEETGEVRAPRIGEYYKTQLPPCPNYLHSYDCCDVVAKAHTSYPGFIGAERVILKLTITEE